MTAFIELLSQAAQACDRADYATALERAQAACAAASHPFEQVKAYEAQMRAYHGCGLYDQALAIGQVARARLAEVETAADIPPDERLGVEERILNTLAASQRLSGDLSSALETRHRQLELGQRMGDARARSEALNGIAVIYASRGEFARAIPYQEQAIALQRDRGDVGQLCRMQSNLADLYLHADQVEAALDIAQQAWEQIQPLGDSADPQVTTQIRYILAEAYGRTAQFDLARAAFEDALRLAERYRTPRTWIDACSRYASFLLRQGQHGQALAVLHRGIAVSEAMGANTPWIYELHRQLAAVYEAMGDCPAALAAYRTYHQRQLAIFNAESEARLRQMEARFRTEAAEREAELFRQQAAAAQRQQELDRQYFERLTRLKDELLATASHDLKNPIAAIRISADLLRRAVDPRLHDHLDRINRQVERINQLIGGVLELARLENGRAITVRDESLTRLIEDGVSRFQPQAEALGIVLTAEPPAEPLIVPLDALLISRVIDNLISNALKYTPAGGTVRVSAARDGDRIRVSVSDTGIGIPEAELERVFERFYRVQSDRRSEVEGTGLGLAIARTIVEQHGGQIDVRSAPGQGSTFTFTLPLT
ncbi:MAG: ATP-binding protein [Candidatus Flexifilum sp.]|jgi:signal transduction histidine kinase